jgi:hypothetical protein
MTVKLSNQVALTGALLVAGFFTADGIAHAIVKTQAAQNVDFSRYRSYQWLPPRVLLNTGLVEEDLVAAAMIRAAVGQELTLRGLLELPSGASIQVATIGRYSHRGTLVVNLIDQATQKSVWVGLATGTFDKPDQLESKVRQAVAEIFSKYPVRRVSHR